MSFDPPKRPSLGRRLAGFFLRPEWLLLPLFLFVLYLGLLSNAQNEAVVASAPVGRLRAVTFQAPDARTVVNTTRGSFLVQGAFPALWNHPLVFETRASGSHALCDRAVHFCTGLFH